MSSQPKKHLSGIRTYANDLVTVRKKNASENKKVAPKPQTKPVEHTPEKPTIRIPETKKEEKKKVISTIPTPKIITPTQTKTEAKKEPTSIPSFHELQKQVKAIQHNNQTKVKEDITTGDKKQKTKTPPRPNVGYDTKVITDTKADRFKFFPTLLNSVKKWFKQLRIKNRRKGAPKFALPETHRRKGVIQSATSKTGAIFTADNDTLRNQIRQRQQEDRETEITATTSWSPFTESSYNLLEAPDATHDVVVEFKKHSSFPATTELVDKVPVEKEEIQTEEVEIDKTIPTKTPPPTIQEGPDDDILNDSRWSTSETDEYDEVEDEDEDEIIYDTIAESDKSYPNEAEDDVSVVQLKDLGPGLKTPINRKLFTETKTNSLTLSILVIIISLTALIYGSVSIAKHFITSNTDVVTIEITPILENSSVLPVKLDTSNINQLIELVQSTVQESGEGVTELPIISPNHTEVSPAYIFNLLKFDTVPVLKQSLTTVRFVTINKNDSVIILKFTDTDTIRGSFFSWETSMLEDMKKIYTIPKETLPIFTDKIVGNIDTRVIKNGDEIILIYGVTDNNVAIISHNLSDFEKIVELTASN